MDYSINKILVVRLHSNMVKAIATQNISITAYGFINQAHVLASEVVGDCLTIIPRNFRFESNNKILNGIRTFRDLSKIIKYETPNVIHVNALQDLLFVFFAARLFTVRKNRPAIIAMSRNPQTWKNPRTAWLAAKSIQFFADGFIALATTHKNQLINLGVPTKKITVIPNPFDNSDRIQIEDLANLKTTIKPKKCLNIMCVANVCERKGLDIFVKAAARVLEKYPELKFDFAGKVDPVNEKYADKLRALICDLNLGDRVRLTGEIPFHEVKTWVANRDIFVFPTRSEMMPRAVIEAMLVGKPVIASAVDGILDLIQNRKTGLLVQPESPENLADAICELVENPELAHELGLAGQKYVLDYCAPERVGELFIDFYQAIMTKRLNNN